MNDSFGPRFPAPEHCPHCRSHNFVRIVYGLPTQETAVRAREGEFVLGGCTLGEASWYCRSCGQRWPKERLWPTDEDALVLRLGPPPSSAASRQTSRCLSPNGCTEVALLVSGLPRPPFPGTNAHPSGARKHFSKSQNEGWRSPIHGPVSEWNGSGAALLRRRSSRGPLP